MQHVINFRLCEAEAFIIDVIGQNCVDIRVVETCEDAFLCDFQTACDYAKLQMWIVLEGACHNGADNRQHLVVIFVMERSLKRHIVFVEKHNAFASKVLVEELRRQSEDVSVEERWFRGIKEIQNVVFKRIVFLFQIN